MHRSPQIHGRPTNDLRSWIRRAWRLARSPVLRGQRARVVLLLAASGFISGFGAPASPGEAPSPTEAPAGAPRDGSAARSVTGADTTEEMGYVVMGPASIAAFPKAFAVNSNRVVAEYAPVAIDSLPVYRADEPESGWPAGGNLTVVTKGVIERGQSLSASLRRQGISPLTIHEIAREMSPVFDFRHSHAGHRYRLGQDHEGKVLDFRYSVSPEKSFYLYWEGSRFVVREDVARLQTQLAKVAAVVDSSLYDAIRDLGEQPQLAGDFADIFMWDIDFSRSVRPGDEFQILYERLYRTDEDGDDIYVKPGRILAARYRGGVGDHSVVYFERENGQGAYYRPDGSSVEGAFLVAPLKFSRISSRYSGARPHPILKVTRPHRGIDYAAAKGTELWSVSSGTVIFRGWAGASGNLVKIKHSNGYVSYYAHLLGFAKGLHVGQPVEQKQVIGYVGATGLATGPHVCFRVQRDGRYVNPLELGGGVSNESITRADWKTFAARRDLLLSDLGASTVVAADEAL